MTLKPELNSTRVAHGTPDETALDDVVWSALVGPHAALAMGDGIARRYPPEVAPFCAARHLDPESLASLAGLVGEGEVAALVTVAEVPQFGALAPMVRATLHQMVLADPVALAGAITMPMETLAVADVPDMLNLVSSTQPGPFGRRTIELGRYIGIRIDGELIAMGGERLKVDGFTEISAICVAPQCRGRGYAGALVKLLGTSILARGETPFLHVLQENVSAIALYERLGFRLRRRFSLGVFKAP
jgi:ribosomal protein S18 acetylase RimI-like enzyme